MVSYRFEADESVRDGIVRCAGEQIDRAVGELSERIGEDPVEPCMQRVRRSRKSGRCCVWRGVNAG